MEMQQLAKNIQGLILIGKIRQCMDRLAKTYSMLEVNFWQWLILLGKTTQLSVVGPMVPYWLKKEKESMFEKV